MYFFLVFLGKDNCIFKLDDIYDEFICIVLVVNGMVVCSIRVVDFFFWMVRVWFNICILER